MCAWCGRFSSRCSINHCPFSNLSRGTVIKHKFYFGNIGLFFCPCYELRCFFPSESVGSILKINYWKENLKIPGIQPKNNLMPRKFQFIYSYLYRSGQQYLHPTQGRLAYNDSGNSLVSFESSMKKTKLDSEIKKYPRFIKIFDLRRNRV